MLLISSVKTHSRSHFPVLGFECWHGQGPILESGGFVESRIMILLGIIWRVCRKGGELSCEEL